MSGFSLDPEFLVVHGSDVEGRDPEQFVIRDILHLGEVRHEAIACWSPKPYTEFPYQHNYYTPGCCCECWCTMGTAPLTIKIVFSGVANGTQCTDCDDWNDTDGIIVGVDEIGGNFDWFDYSGVVWRSKDDGTALRCYWTGHHEVCGTWPVTVWLRCVPPEDGAGMVNAGAGTLFSREDDNNGVVRLNGHGIVAGNTLLLVWSTGSTSVTANAISGTDIQVTVAAGPDPLPDAATAVEVHKTGSRNTGVLTTRTDDFSGVLTVTDAGGHAFFPNDHMNIHWTGGVVLGAIVDAVDGMVITFSRLAVSNGIPLPEEGSILTWLTKTDKMEWEITTLNATFRDKTFEDCGDTKLCSMDCSETYTYVDESTKRFELVEYDETPDGVPDCDWSTAKVESFEPNWTPPGMPVASPSASTIRKVASELGVTDEREQNRYLKPLAWWIASGSPRRDEAERTTMQAKCEACDVYHDGQCFYGSAACGVGRRADVMLRMATEQCPKLPERAQKSC